ncbi:hypothetical protein B0H16DRAFT_1546760 [Mycena metata]|uniref:Uncharacterized protein n=1 Tax=Mycena metata TaxID=1033252 RepID=A0AAD7IYE7_9AGAR|nr:hypothetical protein B0H16DRAFT_1546760 [Mycena metata]
MLTDHVVTSQQITTSKMLTDGWVINSPSHHLIWVPAWLRAHFCHPPTSFAITPTGITTLDLTNFVHGKDWVKCIDGPAMIST